MPTQQTPALRIFCLCGQKMRLNETMYGRRARCIACQLKIRIPRFEEVPRGATELYLHDHPEFIREPRESGQDALAEEEAQAKGRRRKSISVPIDPSETLRQLCSLDKKIKRELRETNGRSKSELEACQLRLKEVRNAFDDELHQRLMEASIELTAAQEKLAELSLASRVGEIDYQTYAEQANRVRWRRECLERRQLNVRAWLAVRDADLAGGYVELPLDRIEEIPIRTPLTEEGIQPEVLLRWMVDQLRAAFAERKQAEQNLAVVARLREQEDVPEKDGKRAAKEQKAIRARATAAIRFWQDRLENSRKDIQNDQGVIEAQLDLARGRRKLGELGRDQFEALERDLRRAKADLEKALQSIDRAVSAPSDRDLPALRGTFIERLGAPRPSRNRSLTIFALLGLLFMAAIVIGFVLGVVYGLIPMPLRGAAPSTQEHARLNEPPPPEPQQEIILQPVTDPAPPQKTTGIEPAEPGQAPQEPAASPPSLPEDAASVIPAPVVEPPVTGPVAEAPATPDEPLPAAPASEDTPGLETPVPETPSNRTNLIEVELRGVVMTVDRAPRFSLRIHTPDGKIRERTRELGDSVAEGWIIREYNPGQQSITLFNGEDILVVRRGEKEPLPAFESEAQ